MRDSEGQNFLNVIDQTRKNCGASKKNIETVSRYIRHVVHHKKKRKSVYGHALVSANDT